MKKIISLAFIFVLIIVLLNSCTDKYPQAVNKSFAIKKTSCIQCHLDADLLKEVAEPLPDQCEATGES